MYHRFIEQISEFIFAEDEPEKRISFLFRGMVIHRWRKRLQPYMGKNMRHLSFQVENTALLSASLAECCRARNDITASTGRNGIF